MLRRRSYPIHARVYHFVRDVRLCCALHCRVLSVIQIKRASQATGLSLPYYKFGSSTASDALQCRVVLLQAVLPFALRWAVKGKAAFASLAPVADLSAASRGKVLLRHGARQWREACGQERRLEAAYLARHHAPFPIPISGHVPREELTYHARHESDDGRPQWRLNPYLARGRVGLRDAGDEHPPAPTPARACSMQADQSRNERGFSVAALRALRGYARRRRQLDIRADDGANLLR